VRREDTSNIVFELIDCLDFVNFCHLLCHVLLEFCIAEYNSIVVKVHIHTSVSFTR